MKIYEYQAKRIFSEAGISIPSGRLITRGEHVGAVLDELPFTKYVLKAQTYTGGRGKAGLIVRADDKRAARERTEELFEKVNRVLIEEQIDIARELYAGITVDRGKSLYTLLFSESGGVDIEELYRDHPERIVTREIDVFAGLLPGQLKEILVGLRFDPGAQKTPGLPGDEWAFWHRDSAPRAGVESRIKGTTPVKPEVGLHGKIQNSIYAAIVALYEVFNKHEATLCEINPLAVSGSGDVIAIDAKIIFDDDALFRHKDILGLRMAEDEEPLEREAKDRNLSYVKLDGTIGCMVNGAGLAMATMDVIKHLGGAPANFLDVGGIAKSRQVKDSLSIISRDSNVQAIFVNIFGGIVRCDEVAKGIVEAKHAFGINKPIFIRLIGTNDRKAYEILEKEGITAYRDMSEAAEAVVSRIA
jgi:succinyl-CoA synthetase beta subunit